MYKKFSFLLAVLLVSLLTACGTGDEGDSSSLDDKSRIETDTVSQKTEEPTQPDAESKQAEVQGHILIAWFSRVGNTKFPDNVDAVSSASLNLQNSELVGNTELIADMIQRETGGELFRIETEKSYPADYNELVDYGKSEPDEDSRPSLSSHVENMEDYDVIFLGFPNWWFDMPMPVYSFLEEYDFSGKTVVPFCTHGGSGFSDTISTLKEILPKAEILDGFEVYGENAADAGEDVSAWLKELNKITDVLQSE